MTYLDIPGWFDYHAIYKLAVDMADDGDHLAELGSFYGCSAAYMGQLIKDSGKKINFHCIDLWQPDKENDHPEIRTDIFNMFMHNMKGCGVDEFIIPHKLSTADAAKEFERQGIEFNFVFVDANHTYPHVVADIRNYLPLVKSGGILAGHDIYFEEVKRAVEENLNGWEIPELSKSCWMYFKP